MALYNQYISKMILSFKFGQYTVSKIDAETFVLRKLETLILKKMLKNKYHIIKKGQIKQND